VEWRQLQVEQGTKAAHGGVEKFAREQLKMLPPHPGQIVVLEGRP
jgi:cell division protein FtsL